MLGMGLDGWILIEPLLAGGGAARHRVLHLSVHFGNNPRYLRYFAQAKRYFRVRHATNYSLVKIQGSASYGLRGPTVSY